MKKIGVLISVILLGVLLTGCGTTFETEENAIFFSKKGTITEASIESFEKEYYSEAELKAFVEEIIGDYNKENGENAVTISKLAVEEKKAKLYLDYATAKDYEKFNGKSLFAGDVIESLAANVTVPNVFFKVTDGVISGEEDFMNIDGGLKMVIVQDDLNVVVDGKILYIAGNADIINKNTVKPKKKNGSAIFVVYK